MTSDQVREELTRYLLRDLHGPWGPDDEELAPGALPSERYILGVLSPRGEALQAETLDASATDDGSGDGAGEVTAAAAAGSMSPASLGLSFTVAEGVETVRVEAAWGSYESVPSDTELTDSGQPRSVWKRTQQAGAVDVDLSQPEWWEVPVAGVPGVVVQTRVTARQGHRTVDVALVNGQTMPATGRDAARLFQAKLTVTGADGAAVFVPHNDPSHVVASGTVDVPDREVAGLRMLYRRSREYAVGRNAAVKVECRDGEDRAWRLTTTNTPTYDVPQTVAPKPADVAELVGLQVDMRWLATQPRDKVLAALEPLSKGYLSWLAGREAAIAGDVSLAGHETAAKLNLKEAQRAAERVQAGIDLLATDDQAWAAWTFMNEAMALQRERTEVARERDKDPELTLPAADKLVDEPSRRSWRPFQLAFVLLNLPSLTDPAHEDRNCSDDADGPGTADLLFFPTGGGKTEAYLGLTAYTLAIRRLHGVVGVGDEARDGGAGVAVVMRYTLRLLTAQQFQRAAALLCAAEKMRRDAVFAERAGGPANPWGDEPFRIGLWVGSRVTPNWYDQAKEALDGIRNQWASAAVHNPVQVLNCPWCNRPIAPGKDAEAIDSTRRVLLWCGDPKGLCPFSRKHSAQWGEGIPAVTVDEEVFRLLPSLLIGTVDKFAQLPLRGMTGLLFGQTHSTCVRHGYRQPDLNEKTGCGDGGHTKPAVKPQACGQLRPPDLVIQDELHLISGALGTMVGLYETAVDRLASWTVDGKRVRPKVVASTATVRRAKEQVHNLFDRDLAVFPPPVLDAGDTFFSVELPVADATPGRRYFGVCAHGQRLKQVQIRVAQILMASAQYLFDQHGEAADPYMTLVDYFNSITELAGMSRMVDDDLTVRLRQQHDKRGLSDRHSLETRELTARVSAQTIGRTLADLGHPFDPAQDSTSARDHFAALRKQSRDKNDKTAADAAKKALAAQRPYSKRPIDVLLATSMLQVGVDVQRLGLMVMTGQPKNSAEYIQATSRVGRDAARPGLVVTIYNWARPRDLAHFETFGHFHETFYSRVEPLSVTPFADRALDRGLTGVLVASLRHAQQDWQPEAGADQVPVSAAAVDDAIGWLAGRASSVLEDATAGTSVETACRARMDLWDARRRGIESGALSYTEKKKGMDPLLDAGEVAWTTWSAGWSLREVEAEANLQIQLAAPEVAERPDWTFVPPPADAPTDDEDDDEGFRDEAGFDGAATVPAAEGSPE